MLQPGMPKSGSPKGVEPRVFAFGYWFVFEVAHASPSPLETWRTETAAAEKKRAEAGPVTNEALAVLRAALVAAFG